jgi:hypothetical protein
MSFSLLSFCISCISLVCVPLATSVRWSWWWCAGIWSLRHLPTSWASDLVSTKGLWGLACQIGWLSSYLSAWCVYQGNMLDGFWSGNFNPLIWWWRMEIQWCVGESSTDVRLTTTRSRCPRRVGIVVFKALYGDDVFAGVPIPHGAISNLRNTKNKERKKAG